MATFVTPNTFHRGHYTLRQELWAEFDPHFPYYTPGARQTAIDRGLDSKLWKPHQQLRWQVEGWPPGMEGLQAFTDTDFGIEYEHGLSFWLLVMHGHWPHGFKAIRLSSVLQQCL